MAKAGKPNILILWGDDIGWWNISYNNRGQMGYWTSNIDRIGHEGATFTDYYGQQSCTAGRAAFITGQNPIRTGLTKVGMPGADVGLRAVQNGATVMPAPVDYVSWTERVAGFATSPTFQGAQNRILWITGEMTPLARQQLASNGWNLTGNTQ